MTWSGIELTNFRSHGERSIGIVSVYQSNYAVFIAKQLSNIIISGLVKWLM